MRDAADARPPPRRAAAHAPGRDARRGGVLPRALRLQPGRVPRRARLARRRRLARALRAPRRRARSRASARPAPASRTARPPTRRLGAGIAPVRGAARRRRAGRARRRRRRLQRGRAARRRAAPGAARSPACAGGPRGADRPRGARSWRRSSGARCLGRDDELGSLEPGKLADIALWRLDGLGHAGIADPVAALVLGAAAAVGRCCSSAARVVVEGGELRTADEADARGATSAGRSAGAARRRDDHRRATAPDDRADGRRRRAHRRPDGILKVQGEFAYSSDLWLDGHALGRDPAQPAPARPDPLASTSRRRCAMPGVYAVLTHEDVPGAQALRPRDRRPAGARHRRASATRASRWRSSPPTTRETARRRRGARSRSTTRCSSR